MASGIAAAPAVLPPGGDKLRIAAVRGPIVYATWLEGPSFEAMRDRRAKIVDDVLSEVVRAGS